MSLKVGVVGVGHLGRHHARLYSIIPDVELIGIADIDRTRAEAIAEEYQCRYFPDYHELLELVEAVSIAVPTSLHHEVTKTFLANDRHVLLEKPIAANLLEAQELVSLAEQHNVILQVGHLERFNPGVLAVRSHIKYPLFIESHRIGPFSARGTDVDVILDLMIHDIDLLLAFTQDSIAEIHSVGVPVLSNRVDIANCRMQFSKGCVANVTASRVSLEPLRKMRIFQPDSYISIDFQNRKSEMFQRDTEIQFDFSKPMKAIKPVFLQQINGEPLKLEIESFIECVTRNQAPLVSGATALSALEVAIQIRKALTPLTSVAL